MNQGDRQFDDLVNYMNHEINMLISLISQQHFYLIDEEYYEILRQQLIKTAEIVLLSYNFKILEISCTGPNDDDFMSIRYKVQTPNNQILVSDQTLEDF